MYILIIQYIIKGLKILNKINYNNYFYTFDIETTTFEHEEQKYTDIYLFSFLKVKFDKQITIDKLEHTPLTTGRTWQEVNQQLIDINEQSKKYNQITIIYVHNLAYEFDGIVKNCSFVRDAYINGTVKDLFRSPRKPIFVRIGNIEFRCSYILLNSSLKALGQLYNYPKLDIDYNNKYYSFSKLPREEYEYNARDVRLQAYAIMKNCNNFSYINNICDIPYTFTSLTRENNKVINTSKIKKSYKNRNIWSLNKYKDNIEILQKVYTGGYTHATAITSARTINNVYSVDIVSSYPDSMLHRRFPHNFKKYNGNNAKMFLNYIIKQSSYNIIDVINNYKQPFKYAFFCKLTIENAQTIKYNNGQDFPTISYNKVVNDCVAVLDNGRVNKTNRIEIYINDIDYFLLSKFYTFNIVNVEELHYTTEFRQLHEFTINCIDQYLHEKSIFKKLHNKIKQQEINKKDFYCDQLNNYIISEEQINNILSLPQQEQQLILTDMLRNAKSKLNAQYGINVQALWQEEYIYNVEDDEYTYDLNKKISHNLFRNFEEGLYITAYSRLNLFSFLLYSLEQDNNIMFLYSDTDSWKVSNIELEEFKIIINKYNSMLEKVCNNSKHYNVGYFDFEERFEHFKTLGAKKYITINNNKVCCTIAGVPKNNINNSMQELYNNIDNVNIFLDTFFTPNTIFDNSIIDKKAVKYYTNSYNGIVTDCNGITNAIQFNNMCELFPCDYALLLQANRSNKQYIEFLEMLQNRYISSDLIKIEKINNKITYNYINNYNNNVNIISEQQMKYKAKEK